MPRSLTRRSRTTGGIFCRFAVPDWNRYAGRSGARCVCRKEDLLEVPVLHPQCSGLAGCPLGWKASSRLHNSHRFADSSNPRGSASGNTEHRRYVNASLLAARGRGFLCTCIESSGCGGGCSRKVLRYQSRTMGDQTAAPVSAGTTASRPPRHSRH